MTAPQIIVLVIAIGGVGKGTWMVLAPHSAQKVTDWWVGISAGVLRVIGILVTLGGLCLLGLAASRMSDPALAAITILGTLWALAGMVYFRPQTVKAFMKPFTSESKPATMRLFGVLVIVVAILLFVAFFHSVRQ